MYILRCAWILLGGKRDQRNTAKQTKCDECDNQFSHLSARPGDAPDTGNASQSSVASGTAPASTTTGSTNEIDGEVEAELEVRVIPPIAPPPPPRSQLLYYQACTSTTYSIQYWSRIDWTAI